MTALTAAIDFAFSRVGASQREDAVTLVGHPSQQINALRQGQNAHDTIQGALRQVQAALPAPTALTERQMVSPPLLEAAIANLDDNTKAQV